MPYFSSDPLEDKKAAKITAGDVGRRLRIWWESENDWFEGIVQSYDEKDGALVLYDDGDDEVLANDDEESIYEFLV